MSNISVSAYGLGIAALAGLLSFLSPCVLALVPAYLGYLSGRSVTPSGAVVEDRRVTFTHGIAFVLGFSLIFILGGAAIGAVGALVGDYDVRRWISRIGGVIVVVFGLHTMGVITIPFLDYDTRRQVRPDPRLGYLSSALMGIFFSAGWAPCIGPVLGAVYTLVLAGGKATDGAILLGAYSVGMAVPFLLAALGVGSITNLLRRHSNIIRYLSIATGVLLVVIGFMLMAGTLERLAAFAPVLPTLDLEESLVR
jgi:cytochrome c-type biogenesis protein